MSAESKNTIEEVMNALAKKMNDSSYKAKKGIDSASLQTVTRDYDGKEVVVSIAIVVEAKGKKFIPLGVNYDDQGAIMGYYKKMDNVSSSVDFNKFIEQLLEFDEYSEQYQFKDIVDKGMSRLQNQLNGKKTKSVRAVDAPKKTPKTKLSPSLIKQGRDGASQG